MRFYTRQHRHYCGIDLHARTMYLCVLSHEGEILLERNLAWDHKLRGAPPEPNRGIDLPRRTIYLCVLSHEGEILLEPNLACDPKLLVRPLEPYRENLVVA